MLIFLLSVLLSAFNALLLSEDCVSFLQEANPIMKHNRIDLR